MTGKTTQQLAREAGIEDYNEMLRSVVVTDNGTYINPVTMADLERFRALVLEEAAGAPLMTVNLYPDNSPERRHYMDGIRHLQEAIRALKEKP